MELETYKDSIRQQMDRVLRQAYNIYRPPTIHIPCELQLDPSIYSGLPNYVAVIIKRIKSGFFECHDIRSYTYKLFINSMLGVVTLKPIETKKI